MTALFIILLSIGVAYAILILIGTELAHFDLPGFHFDLGHALNIDFGEGLHLPSVGPVTFASFFIAFGASGLIAQWLTNDSPTWSLVWAVVGGLTVALISHFAFGYFLLAPQGSSEVTMSDVVGAVAEVMTPIPADSVGEIALVAQGGRVTYPARSATGQPIGRNTTVVVERVVGNIALVRPQ